MNQFSGLLITALSVLTAAIVSGLRLKPYIDAGAAHTPASFMLYPVLITLAITVPVVFLLRKVQGKKDIDIGPIQFNDRMPFIALGCIVYAVISLAFSTIRPRFRAVFRPPSSSASLNRDPSRRSSRSRSHFRRPVRGEGAREWRPRS